MNFRVLEYVEHDIYMIWAEQDQNGEFCDYSFVEVMEDKTIRPDIEMAECLVGTLEQAREIKDFVEQDYKKRSLDTITLTIEQAVDGKWIDAEFIRVVSGLGDI